MARRSCLRNKIAGIRFFILVVVRHTTRRPQCEYRVVSWCFDWKLVRESWVSFRDREFYTHADKELRMTKKKRCLAKVRADSHDAM